MAKPTARFPIRCGRRLSRAGLTGSSLLFFGILYVLTACGQSAVRPVALTRETKLPQPGRILLQDFAVREADVYEYQGLLRQQPANPIAQ
jgi:hypothetical protein